MTMTDLGPSRAMTATSGRTTRAGRTHRSPGVAAEDRHVLLVDPPSGTTVRVAVGRQLGLRLPPGMGPTRWRVTEVPCHLVALADDRDELRFLVFGGAPGPLRLERADPAGGPVQEVREVYVAPTAVTVRRDPVPRASRRAAS